MQQQAAELSSHGDQRRPVNLSEVELLAAGNEVELVAVVSVLSVGRKAKQKFGQDQVGAE